MGGARTTMNGQAVVITASGLMDVYVNINIQGIKGSHNAEFEEVKDFEGFDASWLARNEHIEMDVQVKLTAASKVAAALNGAFMKLLSAVLFTQADLNWINATGLPDGRYTGKWQYRGGSDIDLSADKTGGMTIKLRKYADAAQNLAATTAAS